MSVQATLWTAFSKAVIDHIQNYVIPQYGDESSDLATEYTAEDCVKQIEKYAKRFTRSSRPGERKRDLIKIAHYAQKAWQKVPAEDRRADD